MPVSDANAVPQDYKPFEQLVICGNRFVNGRIPLNLNGHFPFLVGKGADPKQPWVWLSMPASREMINWNNLVEKNESKNKLVSVEVDKDGQVIVRARGQVVIRVTRDSETQATIHQLDLRHIGLRFYGDDNGLMMGTNSFVNNTFSNTDTMLAVSG